MLSGATAITTTIAHYLSEADILTDDRGMPIYEWVMYPTIVNKVDISFDFNVPTLIADDFARRRVYSADLSVERYGPQPAVRLEARGVRSDRNGTALLDEFALRLLQRYGYTPPILKLWTTYRVHTLEVGERVRVDHPLIVNPITGQMGLRREIFEILRIRPSWWPGRMQYTLLWSGAIETSAAPTSALINLIPGLSSIDPTDVPIPFGGSAIVTTAAGVSKFRIGLKHLTYRLWHCRFNPVIFVDPGGKGGSGSCQPGAQVYVNRSYTGSVTYRMEYKTASAPNSPGSGGNPATGWVELLPSTTRGAVAQYAARDCKPTDEHPPVPGEDFWSHLFESPGAAPNQYNIRIFWTAVGQQANPCSAMNPDICNTGGCTGGSLAESVLHTDQLSFTCDYVESIT